MNKTQYNNMNGWKIGEIGVPGAQEAAAAMGNTAYLIFPVVLNSLSVIVFLWLKNIFGDLPYYQETTFPFYIIFNFVCMLLSAIPSFAGAITHVILSVVIYFFLF